MGVKVVQLTSKSYHHNILVSLEQLRLQGHLSDVTVQVDHQGHSQEFQAHRVVLAASSGYFKNIFLSQDAAQNTVLLSDIHSDDFSKFLEFVYTGKIQIAQDKIVDVQTAAQFLDCVDLSEVCGEAMSAGILQKPLKKTSASKVADKDDSNSDKMGDGAKEKKQSEGLHPKRHLSPQSPERDVVSKRFKATRAENNEKNQSIEVKRRLAGRKVLKRRSNGKSEILNNETQVSNEDTEECEDRSKVKAQHENQAEKGEEISLGTAVPGEDEWTCEDDGHSNDPEDPSVLSHEEEEEEEKEGEDGEQLKEMLKRTSKAQFQCNKCQRTFHYERSYLKHISTYHGVKADIVYRCETCQQTFANRSNLKIHEKHVHSSERLFSCESCMKTFKRKKDVVRHQRQVHERNNLNHVCPVCGKALSSKTALLLHERTHTGDKPFECTDCGSRFTQNSALKMHRRTHTGEKPFACDQCEARFTQKHMLDYHKRSHSGEKPFMCEACGKSFASKEYLRYHSNIHTGSKPFKCDKCGRGFAQRNSLNQHSKIHTGERPYVCKDCQKPFTQLNALQRHRRIHTGEKPYMCGLCSRTFTDKSTLRRHAMMHDSDAPWKTYLVVLEGNVEDKKPKSPAKGKTDKAGEKKGAARKSGGAAAADATDGVPGKINTDSIMVPAEPVTLASDWTSHGITLVSHSGITVIHTEVPAGAQIQPIMTTDSTGTSVISLDGSTIPFSIPVSMAHPIPLSSDASSTSLSVPSVLSVSATEIATVSTSSVLETAASQTILVPDSDPKTTSEIAIVHPNIETVIVGDKHCAKDQTAAVQSDGEKMAAQNISDETKVASDQEAV